MDQVQRAELAAVIREALVSVAEVAWRAKDADLGLNETLELVLPECEVFVQSLVRAADR